MKSSGTILFMNAIITNISRAPRARVTGFATGRTIHLIDIENLCGEARPSKAQVEHARKRYLGVVGGENRDQFIVASSKGNLLNSSSGWPKARYLARDGKDGADICLARVVVEEGVAERFDSVVMASGDHGLAPFVSQLARRGLDTTVVSLRDSLSRDMRMAAHKCIVLTPELEDIA